MEKNEDTPPDHRITAESVLLEQRAACTAQGEPKPGVSPSDGES